MENKIVAIITARGGSKGLPRKNVLDLCGKPLIAHTIEAAIKSSIFDKIIVTTDDEEIKEVSIKYGADVINRPKELASDTASSLDVIEHSLYSLIELGETYTHFVLLQPTSPLRNEIHIKDSWTTYLDTSSNSLVSVSEVEHPPQKMLIQNKNGDILPLTKWEDLTKPRQQLEKAYQPNGAIYICNIENFLGTKNIFLETLHIFIMDKENSLDIDNMNDLDQVKRIIDERNK